MDSILYPFKFTPIYKQKIWGGQKIKSVLKKDFGNLTNCGEAWLISGVENEPSVVSNGQLAGNELNELVEIFMGDMVGDAVFEKYGERFPLLIKVLDSNDWLSVQVHPNDELAAQMGIGSGKTEMWYVMQADNNAELISGFAQATDSNALKKCINDDKITELLNFEKVSEGDVFFIPAGRIHALGPGCLVAEIQQTSDNTFRIFDWNRIDQNGMMRELHTEQALQALDYTFSEDYRTHYSDTMDKTVPMVDSPFFVTNTLQLDAELTKDYSELDSFVILFCVAGGFDLAWENGIEHVNCGECLLLPNIINKISIRANGYCRLLETYIIEQ